MFWFRFSPQIIALDWQFGILWQVNFCPLVLHHFSLMYTFFSSRCWLHWYILIDDRLTCIYMLFAYVYVFAYTCRISSTWYLSCCLWLPFWNYSPFFSTLLSGAIAITWYGRDFLSILSLRTIWRHKSNKERSRILFSPFLYC